ncbi:MAG: hypothetical protein D6695_03540 [Planctomycetota bacterium]|nr:MAG: hypothetical protein D6695_03540 [Planctomycetota bacterium]
MSEQVAQREVLIGRVIDGEASSADWEQFRMLAEREPEVWEQLRQTQQMHAQLCGQVACACAVAEEVDLPVDHAQHEISHRLRLAGSWGGWLAAAGVALAWAVGMPAGGNGLTGSLGPAIGPDYVQIRSPEDALRTYVDRGRDAGVVVGLVPQPRVIETRTLPDGSGVEVVLVREIVERRLIDQVYRLSQDEAGNMIPVQVKLAPTSDSPF